MNCFSEKFTKYVGDTTYSMKSIDIYMVDYIVNQLQTGKAVGLHRLSAEHLKHSHPILISILKILFNVMIRTNYVPNAFAIMVSQFQSLRVKLALRRWSLMISGE